MPRVSQFFGITIAMYFNDHAPPHFHAYYGEYEALVVIETLDIYEGSLPGRALALVPGVGLATPAGTAGKLGAGAARPDPGADRAAGLRME